jgi:hypothetical protein
MLTFFAVFRCVALLFKYFFSWNEGEFNFNLFNEKKPGALNDFILNKTPFNVIIDKKLVACERLTTMEFYHEIFTTMNIAA